MTRIGVVGGYGAVGRAAAREFARAAPDLMLRIGGRDPDRAAAVVHAELGGPGEAVRVDVFDPDSVAAFCVGCDVVVHAGAASYRAVDSVARPALAAGADYVDAGGDEPLMQALTAAPPQAGRRALVTTGMMPGLTGLLPRWLVREQVPAPRRMTVYVGVMDRLTQQGAVDYLLSLGTRDREAQAVWRAGSVVPQALGTLTDVELPFFPGPVTAHPYLGYEGARLGAALGLEELRWYAVFDGGAAMMRTLARLQGAMQGDGDLEAAARELAVAADLDMFGRRAYQLMVYELTGADEGGAPVVRTLVARSSDTSRLTGTVCAIGALEVLAGTVPPGAGFAAEMLDPGRVVAALRGSGVLDLLEVRTGRTADAPVEEGVL